MYLDNEKSRTPVLPNPDFPPWGYVRTPELARICGISIQTAWNWRVRNRGPASIQDRARRNWYRLADVQSWLEKTRSPDEIILAWIEKRFPGLCDQCGSLDTMINVLESNKLIKPVRKPKRLLIDQYITAA
jgi:hypothetical protein